MQPTYEAEFREFMAARWPALVRTAYLLSGDRQHAEDLAQTALEKCAAHWQRVRAADDVDSYVRRMLVNAHLSRFRRRRVTEVLGGDVAETRTGRHADDAHRVAQRDELLMALAGLPRRQRATVVLRYWEDLSESQIAEILGCSVGTVRSQTHRALHKLRVSPVLAETASEYPPLAAMQTRKGNAA
jgi:RNA polymerase sigma-70 factor (sigma-E family)